MPGQLSNLIIRCNRNLISEIALFLYSPLPSWMRFKGLRNSLLTTMIAAALITTAIKAKSKENLSLCGQYPASFPSMIGSEEGHPSVPHSHHGSGDIQVIPYRNKEKKAGPLFVSLSKCMISAVLSISCTLVSIRTFCSAKTSCPFRSKTLTSSTPW